MGYHAVQIQSNTIGGRITCLIQNQNSMVDGLFRSRDVKGKYSLLVLPYYMNLTSLFLLLHCILTGVFRVIQLKRQDSILPMAGWISMALVSFFQYYYKSLSLPHPKKNCHNHSSLCWSVLFQWYQSNPVEVRDFLDKAPSTMARFLEFETLGELSVGGLLKYTLWKICKLRI